MFANFIKEEKTTIIIAFLGIFATYILVFVHPIIGGDDWEYLFDKNFGNIFAFRSGRWMQMVMTKIFDGRILAPSVTTTIFAISHILFSIVAARILKFKEPAKYLFILSLLLFPIWSEAYTFKLGHFHKSLALILCSIAAWIFNNLFSKQDGEWSLKKIFSSPKLYFCAFLLSIVASCYQTYTFLFVILFLLLLIVHINNNEPKALIRNLFFSGVFVVVTALVFYVLEVILLMQVFGINMRGDGSRYDISNPLHLGTIGNKVEFTFRSIRNFYFYPQILFPPISKFFFGVLSAISFYSIFKNITKEKRITYVVFILFLLMAILIIPWILGFVRSQSPFRFNSMIVLSIIYSFFACYSLNYIKSKPIRIFVFALTIINITIYALQINQAIASKYYSNQMDINLGQQVLSRINELPGLEREKEYSLLVYGKLKTIPNERPFKVEKTKYDIRGVLNCGVFDCQTRRMDSLFKLCGSTLDLVIRTSFTKRKKSEQKLHIKRNLSQKANLKAEAWPSPNSILLSKDGKKIIILLEDI